LTTIWFLWFLDMLFFLTYSTLWPNGSLFRSLSRELLPSQHFYIFRVELLGITIAPLWSFPESTHWILLKFISWVHHLVPLILRKQMSLILQRPSLHNPLLDLVATFSGVAQSKWLTPDHSIFYRHSHGHYDTKENHHHQLHP
jgi:hypothetical protein